MKKNLLSILAFILGLGSLGAVALGGTNTKFVGSLPTSLSGSGITSSSVSIGVTSLTLKQTGQKLTISDFGTTIYATIEPGNVSRQEFVSCTGITQNSNGSAILTTCSRGLSPVYPYTASTTMQFSHSGGATLIVSNSPPFYDTFANKNNDGTITGIFTYSSTSLPVVEVSTTDAQLIANGTSTLATVNYVNGVAVAGASDATEAVKGIVELGTALETASSTIFGATGASAVMQSRYATDTPLSGCASGFTSTAGAGCSVIATLAGKIKQTWLDIFTTANTWVGNQIFSGTASFASTTVFSATSTFGAGVIGVVDVQTFTASSSWVKPNGVSTSSMMMVELWGAGGGGGTGTEGGGNTGYAGGGGGGAYTRHYMLTSSATSTVFCRVGQGGASDTAGGNTVFGSYVTAYGGGAGGLDASASFGSGGGGGGSTSAGGDGTDNGTTGGNGGNTNFGAGGAANTTGGNGNSGGGGGATTGGGGQGYWGGGGGAAGGTNNSGGASTYGGGGGAGANNSGSSGGTSAFGGAGGAENGTQGIGADGSYPAGGGAGGFADWDGGTDSFAGGRGASGKCQITTWK